MTDFADFVVEMFESLGKVQAKKMFGGHGIFHDGLMIGLIADDELYLKADEQGAEKFKALGLGPFEYNKNGKVMAMSYYRAPEEVLERPDMATEWARDAYEAALRSHKPKKPKATRKMASRPAKKVTKKVAKKAKQTKKTTKAKKKTK